MMKTLDDKCSRFANTIILEYTVTMANLLDVNLPGSSGIPVADTKGWILAIRNNPSKEQLQKWIFAWRFLQERGGKDMGMKSQEERFETKFMNHHNLRYDKDLLSSMKKNEKTCIQRRYAMRFATVRDNMAIIIREITGISVSVTRPPNMLPDKKRYRRNPSCYFVITKSDDGITTTWEEVSKHQTAAAKAWAST
jgi:hypothetical protein